MLSVDSLVIDLIFNANAQLDQQALIDGLGGEDAIGQRKMLDADMLDPRAEMELSPSMPFRRRGERRLLMIDDSVAPMRKDPNADPVIPLDLRPYKEELIKMCTALPMRLGRLFSLGTWGDAVLVARTARDLRGIALLLWALDPQVDIDGKRRASRLNQQEFEAKILAYEKRLDELDDGDILANVTGATFERRGELLVLDVLEADGTWDQRKSLVMETQLAALDRFSLIPGAPSIKRAPEPAKPAAGNGAPAAAKAAATAPAPVPAPAPVVEEPKGPPVSVAEVGGKLVIVFPPERFDLDVAAALGKGDWDAVLRRSDQLPGATRDKIHRDGAAWVAPLEFLSEVFVEGKPLTRPGFDQGARPIGDGARALDVHFPRFGPVTLIDVAGKGRFVTSLVDGAERIAELVRR
jgi:hypothetical protein